MTPELISIGRACGLLQRRPGEFRQATQKLRIEATLIIDAIDHFNEQDFCRVAEHFRSSDSAPAIESPELNH